MNRAGASSRRPSARWRTCWPTTWTGRRCRARAPEANTSLRLLAPPLPVEVDSILKERFGIARPAARRGDRGEPHLLAAAGRGEQAQRGGRGDINDEYFDVRIFDDDDFELPRGTDGEIVIRPKRPHTMFEGYWGRPEATVATSATRWYHTGDIGRIDDEDYLFFVDRKADYLRRRGENILELRRRAHPHEPWRARRRRRPRGAERDHRGRPQGDRHGGRGDVGDRGGSSGGASTSCRTRCPATSSSGPSCPAAPWAASSSASCATRASPRRRGTPRRAVSPTRSADPSVSA